MQKPESFIDGRPIFGGIDLYTRRGDFQPDKNGYLVNGAGYYLMGIPVDATTGNLAGSVPQILQFQNDFLPAQPTTQIEYRANLASYPLTPQSRHQRAGLRTDRSEDLLGQPGRRRAVAGARSPASAARCSNDAIAVVTGTQMLPATLTNAGSFTHQRRDRDRHQPA